MKTEPETQLPKVTPVEQELASSVDPEYPFGPEYPSTEKIKELGSKYGQIFVTMLGNYDYYLLRKIGRREYRDIRRKQNEIGALAEHIQNLSKSNPQSPEIAEFTEALEDATFELEEFVTALCLVFPKLDAEQLSVGDAGIPQTLYETILQISGFLTLARPVPLTE